jgi:membrane dipeptidase
MTMTYIIDAHEDIACSALSFERDYRLSAAEIRKSEIGTQYPVWNMGEATLGWPDYQQGKVALIFATLFIAPAKYSGGPWDLMAYKDLADAAKMWQGQLDYYHRLCNESPDKFKLVLNRRDLHEVLAPWKAEEPGNKPVGLVLSIEGAEALHEPAELADYYEQGIRLVGPVWAGTRYCAGTAEDRPFDEEGFELLEVMSSLGIPLDISHMREKSALTAMDHFEGEVYASHANAASLLKGSPSVRHLTDLTIQRLFERQGVVGVVPFNRFLVADWTPTIRRETITIKKVIEQIDYYCQIQGSSKGVGIGSDFDGGFGSPNIPLEMETIADLQIIGPALKEIGYTAQDICNIFHQNWENKLERILPA